jgi:hypothetical protein
MARTFGGIERDVRGLSRNDQVRLLRTLLDELEALADDVAARPAR